VQGARVVRPGFATVVGASLAVSGVCVTPLAHAPLGCVLDWRRNDLWPWGALPTVGEAVHAPAYRHAPSSIL
jgi:hypothetical protein